MRHRPRGRGLQHGLPRLQLQRHRGPPLPQPVFADRLRRGHRPLITTIADAVSLFVYFRMLCSALSKEKSWTSRLLQIAFTAGVCGFLVQAMTDYSFYNYRVMFLFWAYLALGAASSRRSQLPKGRLLV